MENSEKPIVEQVQPKEVVNPFKFNQPLLTNAELRQNYTLLSDYTHALTRSESYTT